MIFIYVGQMTGSGYESDPDNLKIIHVDANDASDFHWDEELNEEVDRNEIPPKIKEALRSPNFNTWLKDGISLTSGFGDATYEEDLENRLNKVFDDWELEWQRKELCYSSSEFPKKGQYWFPHYEHYDTLKEWRVGIKVVQPAVFED